MAALPRPSEQAVNACARRIQEKFLQECENDSTEFDPRDVYRVRHSMKYVEKFARHKFADFDEAYAMLVNALKWRKTFGVNDLRFDKLDHSYFEHGLSYPHGEDRNGCNLVILNVHLHKKDSKKFPELQKFLVFGLESFTRKFPDKKLTLFFNMSQSGLGNMDLEFVRFIVNCFKFYFPDSLGYLLVFEMPWVLQAAWKIIKSWLSDAAVNKIKFVTKSDVTDYVSPDNLLVDFGGMDTYKFSFDKEAAQREAEEVWQTDCWVTVNGPTGASVDTPSDTGSLAELFEDDQTGGDEHEPMGKEAVEKEEGLDKDEDSRAGRRQVHFASSIPPSHQTRFGDDGTSSLSYRPRNSEQAKLLKGSAASPGYRRRQVKKLMSRQQSTDKEFPPSVSRHHDVEYSSLPSSLRPIDSLTNSATYQSIPFISLSPSDELLFCGKVDDDLYCTIQLTNTSDQTVAYKIKTTAPLRYKVRPNINLIDPLSVTTVQVLLVPGASKEPVSQDKFLVQGYMFENGSPIPDVAQLSIYWKSIKSESIFETRMKCRYSSEVIHKSLDQQRHQVENSSASGAQHVKDVSLSSLLNKLDQLSKLTLSMEARQKQIWRLQVILIAIVVLLVALVLI